jgi:hypothetical protein
MDQKDIYKTVMMGKEAYLASKFSTQNVRTIIKPVGSSGAFDPLDQFGSIGWKASVDFPLTEMEKAVAKWRGYFDSIP